MPARNYKAYYGAYGSYSRNGDNGLLDTDIRSYSLNKEKHELTLFPDYDTLGKKYSYSIKDSVLRLETIYDQTANQKYIQVFHRRIINKRD